MPEAGGSNVEVAQHPTEREESRQSEPEDLGGYGARRSRYRHRLERLSGTLWTGISRNCTAKRANYGWKPRWPQQRPTMSVCMTLRS
jgi:hypothetical protein